MQIFAWLTFLFFFHAKSWKLTAMWWWDELSLVSVDQRGERLLPTTTWTKVQHYYSFPSIVCNTLKKKKFEYEYELISLLN